MKTLLARQRKDLLDENVRIPDVYVDEFHTIDSWFHAVMFGDEQYLLYDPFERFYKGVFYSVDLDFEEQ